ncbi:hypothetical protein M2419_005671, partial [Sphingobacterium sp. BIGb0116]|nr:hypothetical protein [Sphingobacterium sp. BIGb0116]
SNIVRSSVGLKRALIEGSVCPAEGSTSTLYPLNAELNYSGSYATEGNEIYQI